MPQPLLQVRNLTTRFRTERGTVTAVDQVSFDVAAGETVAIVGESGSGKSVTALSILRLIPTPPGRIDARRDRVRGPGPAASSTTPASAPSAATASR